MVVDGGGGGSSAGEVFWLTAGRAMSISRVIRLTEESVESVTDRQRIGFLSSDICIFLLSHTNDLLAIMRISAAPVLLMLCHLNNTVLMAYALKYYAQHQWLMSYYYSLLSYHMRVKTSN